ncbi:hypothetical protein [Paraburkholderia sp. RL17-381-BIF-C]|uniref:hypothetical protein n=1 Tax=Paraburkholderia sp. RL17-381-BIF-C TaxID=3031635 RepID=UPI0038B9BDE0
MRLFARRFQRDLGVAVRGDARFGAAASKDDYRQRKSCQPPVFHISLPIVTFNRAMRRCTPLACF